MIRRSVAMVVVAAAVAPFVGGCAHVDALVRADAIEREMRVAHLRFYEKLGDAYFILGYDYYCLAKEAEDSGRLQRAGDYATRAKIYHVFSRDARAAATELRAELEGEGTGGALAYHDASDGAGRAEPPPAWTNGP